MCSLLARARVQVLYRCSWKGVSPGLGRFLFPSVKVRFSCFGFVSLLDCEYLTVVLEKGGFLSAAGIGRSSVGTLSGVLGKGRSPGTWRFLFPPAKVHSPKVPSCPKVLGHVLELCVLIYAYPGMFFMKRDFYVEPCLPNVNV